MLFGLSGLHGCRDSETSGELASLADAGSVKRLESIPAESSVLISLHGKDRLTELPPATEGGRELGRYGKSVLLEMPRSAVSALAGSEEIERLFIWGDEQVVGRLDPLLRGKLLSRLDNPDRQGEPVSVIASFKTTDPKLLDSLVELGAEPGSQSGGIVTLTATPDVLMQILARPDLIKLEQSKLLKPMQKMQPIQSN